MCRKRKCGYWLFHEPPCGAVGNAFVNSWTQAYNVLHRTYIDYDYMLHLVLFSPAFAWFTSCLLFQLNCHFSTITNKDCKILSNCNNDILLLKKWGGGICWITSVKQQSSIKALVAHLILVSRKEFFRSVRIYENQKQFRNQPMEI